MVAGQLASEYSPDSVRGPARTPETGITFRQKFDVTSDRTMSSRRVTRGIVIVLLLDFITVHLLHTKSLRLLVGSGPRVTAGDGTVKYDGGPLTASSQAHTKIVLLDSMIGPEGLPGLPVSPTEAVFYRNGISCDWYRHILL